MLIRHARAIRRAIPSEKGMVVERAIGALPRVVTRQSIFHGAVEGEVFVPNVLSVGVSMMVQYVGQKIGRVLAKLSPLENKGELCFAKVLQ